MQLRVPCQKPQLPPNSVEGLTGCNHSIFIAKAGKWIGTYDSKNNDTDPDRMIRYLQAMSGPFPKPVSRFSDLQALRKEYSSTTAIPVGIFDPVKDAEAFKVYHDYAAARRADGRLFAVVDTSKLEGGLEGLMESVLPELASEVQTPAIVLIKNYADASANVPHLFGGGLHAEDEWTEEGVNDFLERNKHRLLSHYGKETNDKDNQKMGEETLRRRGMPVAHLYLASAHGQAEIMKKVQQAALKMSRKLSFVYHDQADEDGVPGQEVLLFVVLE